MIRIAGYGAILAEIFVEYVHTSIRTMSCGRHQKVNTVQRTTKQEYLKMNTETCPKHMNPNMDITDNLYCL